MKPPHTQGMVIRESCNPRSKMRGKCCWRKDENYSFPAQALPWSGFRV